MIILLLCIVALFLLVVPVSIYVAPIVFILFAGFSIFVVKHCKEKKAIDVFKDSSILIKGLSLIIDARFAYSFFQRWVMSGKLKAVSDSVGVDHRIILSVLTFGLFALSFFAILIVFAIVNDFCMKDRFRKEIHPLSSRFAVIAAAIASVAFWLIQNVLPLWGNTDNYRISLVLNGVFSEENYCIFLHPLIAQFVKGQY